MLINNLYFFINIFFILNKINFLEKSFNKKVLTKKFNIKNFH